MFAAFWFSRTAVDRSGCCEVTRKDTDMPVVVADLAFEKVDQRSIKLSRHEVDLRAPFSLTELPIGLAARPVEALTRFRYRYLSSSVALYSRIQNKCQNSCNAATKHFSDTPRLKAESEIERRTNHSSNFTALIAGRIVTRKYSSDER